MGWATAVLTTSSNAESVGPLVAALRPHGQLSVRHPLDLFKVVLFQLEIEEEDTIRFSALQGVAPIVERIPLEKAEEAFAKMMAGQARFRMILDPSLR